MYDQILKLWAILDWPNTAAINTAVPAALMKEWGSTDARLDRRPSYEVELTINPRRKLLRSRPNFVNDAAWTPTFEAWLFTFLRDRAIEAQVQEIKQREEEALFARAAEVIDRRLA